MKNIIITISILLMVGLFAVSAFAWGHGGHGGWNNGTGYNTESYRTFLNDTQALRASITADRVELNALMAGTNPDPKKARKLSEQISKSENELRVKAREYNITGMGPEMMGYGTGMGPEMMGYGNGWSCGWN